MIANLVSKDAAVQHHSLNNVFTVIAPEMSHRQTMTDILTDSLHIFYGLKRIKKGFIYSFDSSIIDWWQILYEKSNL